MTGTRVVYYAPGDLRIESQNEVPQPGAGEVLVRIEACAICGTDVKSYALGNPRIRPPRTMGHEFCGILEAVGEGVVAYRPGQRVTMATTMGCGDCFYCRQGRTNICPDLEAMGFHHDGAMATHVVIPKRGVAQGNLVDVGELDAELAALAEPLSCVVNNLSRVRKENIESMLVIGLGPLGLFHVITGRFNGIATIVGMARPGARMEAAKAFPLDDLVRPEEIDAAIRRHTQGRGFDLVVVTAPAQDVQGNAPAFARKGGFVSLFAGMPKGQEAISLNSRTLHYGEQTMYGTSDSTVQHVQQAVLILGKCSPVVRKMITHRLPFSDAVDGIHALQKRQALKVVLSP